MIRVLVGVVALPAALLASTLACSAAETIPTDIDITMTVGDKATHFAIPKRYLKDPQNRKGGDQDVLTLSVSLPDLHPKFSAKQLADLGSSVGTDGVPAFHEQTGVLVLPGRPNVSRLFRQDLEMMADETGEIIFGLKKYAHGRHMEKTPNNFYLRADLFYYVPPDDGADYGLRFECYAKTFVDRCRGRGNYNETLYYSYYFAKENLKHWKALDTNVRVLLELFERAAKSAD